MHEARLWRELTNGRVQCELCSHFCPITPGGRGRCAVRENRGGTLYTLVYDRVAAINLDPVEKKPLYHFLPGTTTFSLGTMGCNLACSFCQNWSLSQPPRQGRPISGQHVTPEALVDGALEHGAASISYTYSEPTVFFELMADTSALAVDRGLKNIMVTNGFMTEKCLDSLGQTVHAANVDLKAFSDETYRTVCDGRLAPVLDNLRHMKALDWWLEVTTLVIPGLNDAPEELSAIAGFIATELSPDTPWHLSRFHPDYRMTDRPITPTTSLEAGVKAGQEAGLNYVYVGNVPGHRGGATRCPGCGALCVDRRGFYIAGHKLHAGSCQACGLRLPGVGWETLEEK